MAKLQEKMELNQLLDAGSSGHFPLFFRSWIVDSFADVSEVKRMSFSRAAETVHRVYNQIEKYHSIERKKTALQALEDKERNEFILSFMKMVEYRTLDKVKELH